MLWWTDKPLEFELRWSHWRAWVECGERCWMLNFWKKSMWALGKIHGIKPLSSKNIFFTNSWDWENIRFSMTNIAVFSSLLHQSSTNSLHIPCGFSRFNFFSSGTQTHTTFIRCLFAFCYCICTMYIVHVVCVYLRIWMSKWAVKYIRYPMCIIHIVHTTHTQQIVIFELHSTWPI